MTSQVRGRSLITRKSPSETDLMVSTSADSIRRLEWEAGLVALPQVRPVDVKQTESDQHRRRVEAGKDTSGNGGKSRDAYLPDSVERDLQRFQNEHNIPTKDPLSTCRNSASALWFVEQFTERGDR